jgi:hypothetical protein
MNYCVPDISVDIAKHNFSAWIVGPVSLDVGVFLEIVHGYVLAGCK